jgi:hypothetical protein
MLATTTSMRGSAAAAGRSSLSTATTRSVCVGFVHRPLHANGGLLPCSIGSSIGLAYHRHEAAPASHVASAGKGGFGAQRDKLPPSETCPCCLGKKVYKECCAPFHTGNATPETPEQVCAVINARLNSKWWGGFCGVVAEPFHQHHIMLCCLQFLPSVFIGWNHMRS